MKSSPNLQKDTSKGINELLAHALATSEEYLKRKKSVDQKEGKAQLMTQLANSLEGLHNDYSSIVWKYELLTVIYEQKSKVNIKNVSKSIDNLLSNKIGRPLIVHNIDLKGYSEISNDINGMRPDLRTLEKQLSQDLKSYVEKCKEKIAFVKKILTIPDLAKELPNSEDLFRCMSQIEDFLEKSESPDNLEQVQALKKEWGELNTQFESCKNIQSFDRIKESHNFSDNTLEVIRMLVEGNELSLSSVSPSILADLSKFEDFCKMIALKFKTLEEPDDDI